MTPAEHAALSAQLAQAIGWRLVDVVDVADYEESVVDVVCRVRHKGDRFARVFDYRDPSVTMPVLEWLMREHGASVPRLRDNVRESVVCTRLGKWGVGDTLPEAIARAAIAVAEEKRKRVEQNENREVLQP